MTPREWCLLEDGAAETQKIQDRRIAWWLSPLLSATAGEVIQPWQLLGEERPKDNQDKPASDRRAAERRYKAMMRKIAKQNQKGTQCPA